MPAAKRKKFSRQRGSSTHGWGAKKRHRGKGNKGGAGMAGTGKRADTKKPSIWKNELYFGKHGFKKKGLKEEIKAINVSLLDQKIEKFVAEKKAKSQQGTTSINLADIGFNKLLGSGKVTKKMRITAKYSSQKAMEAIKKAGGELILEKKKESKEKEEPKETKHKKEKAEKEELKKEVEPKGG